MELLHAFGLLFREVGFLLGVGFEVEELGFGIGGHFAIVDDLLVAVIESRRDVEWSLGQRLAGEREDLDRFSKCLSDSRRRGSLMGGIIHSSASVPIACSLFPCR